MGIHLYLWVVVFFLSNHFLGQANPSTSQPNLAFQDFPAREEPNLMVKNVDLKSHPKAPSFRTRLNEAIGQKPDFAGYYRVVAWGAGTMAQTTVLIDARDGKVYFAPFTSMLGVSHRPNSRLLVENPSTEISAYVKDSGEPKPKWLETLFWEWDEDRKSFHRLPGKG